jgi:hypothetical protein
MIATGMLNELLDELAGQLLEADLPVVIDPRNVTPPAVLVEPPSIVAMSGLLVELRFPVIALAPPPGTLDQLRALLALADRVVQVVPCTGGEPTVWGPTDLPAYRMTVNITARRD